MPDTLQFVQDRRHVKHDTEVCLIGNRKPMGIGRADTPARDGMVFGPCPRRNRSSILPEDGVDGFTPVRDGTCPIEGPTGIEGETVMELVAEASGWLGALTVLAGYAAFSLGWLRDNRIFQICNLAGSAALLINGYHHGAMPSVVVNTVWGLISIIALVRTGAGSRSAPVADDPPLLGGGPLPEARGARVQAAANEERR